jgi:hypothetical protein
MNYDPQTLKSLVNLSVNGSLFESVEASFVTPGTRGELFAVRRIVYGWLLDPHFQSVWNTALRSAHGMARE